MASRLVIKVTRAADDPERAHIGCNVGAVALASGLDVHLFLAIEGVHLAVPGVAEGITLEAAPPLADLLAAIYRVGSVTVCSPCAIRRGLGEDDFREGTVLAGSARFVELLAGDGATGLVY
jgi:predicted peroxiredoxin